MLKTTAEKLVAAGIVMPVRADDAQAIIAEAAAEAVLIVAAIENGELWQDTRTGEWHRRGRRGFHRTPTEAWREPPWKETHEPKRSE